MAGSINVRFCSDGEKRDKLLKQSTDIKFFSKLGKSASKAFQMLKESFGADAIKKTNVSR
jgi:hypothetical protein